MPPGSARGSKPRGNVNSITIDIVAFDYHVAEIDANSENDCSPTIRAGRWRRKDLHGYSAIDRVDHAPELHQRAVADELDDPAVVGGHQGVEDLVTVTLQRGEGTGLVVGH